MEKFIAGLIVGGLGGALLVTNNYKMRLLVKKSQDEVQAKLDGLMEEKLQAMEEGAKKATDTVKEKMKQGVEKAKNAGKVKNSKE